MTIHELFERHYAEHNGIKIEAISSCRLSNGSYNNLPIARAFRMFKAGFEANQGEKVQVLGYLSNKDLELVRDGDQVSFAMKPTQWEPIAVFVKQSEPLKTGDEA